MGNSSSTVQGTATEASPLSFFWFNTSTSTILYITEDSITYHPISSLRINKNCSVAYTKENNIIIAGGLKTSAKPTKKAYFINTKSKTVNRLTSLARPSYCSDLLLDDGKIYLIEPTLESQHQCLSSGRWSLIAPNPLNLINSASFICDSSLFFLSGTKRNQKPTKKIYKLGLKGQKNYLKLNISTPFKLLKPKIVKGTSFIVVGGEKKANGDPNFQVFVGNFYFDNWKVIEAPKFPICAKPYYIQNTVIWVEFHKVITLNGAVWNIFNISDEALKYSENLESLNRKSNKLFIIKRTDSKELPIENQFSLHQDRLNIEELDSKPDTSFLRDQSREIIIPNTPNSESSPASGSKNQTSLALMANILFNTN